MAGQAGCSYDKTQSVNVLNDTSYGNLLGEPIRGVADSAAIPSPFTAAPSTGDAIRIFRSDDENEAAVQIYDPATAQFTFAISTVTPTLPAGFSKGDTLVVTDCDTAAVFQASDPAVAGTTVLHVAGAAAPTGNCVANLGPKPLLAGACSTATSKPFPPGSKVTKVLGTFYYIAANPAGEPALYRQRLVKGVPERKNWWKACRTCESAMASIPMAINRSIAQRRRRVSQTGIRFDRSGQPLVAQ